MPYSTVARESWFLDRPGIFEDWLRVPIQIGVMTTVLGALLNLWKDPETEEPVPQGSALRRGAG